MLTRIAGDRLSRYVRAQSSDADADSRPDAYQAEQPEQGADNRPVTGSTAASAAATAGASATGTSADSTASDATSGTATGGTAATSGDDGEASSSSTDRRTRIKDFLARLRNGEGEIGERFSDARQKFENYMSERRSRSNDDDDDRLSPSVERRDELENRSSALERERAAAMSQDRTQGMFAGSRHSSRYGRRRWDPNGARAERGAGRGEGIYGDREQRSYGEA